VEGKPPERAEPTGRHPALPDALIFRKAVFTPEAPLQGHLRCATISRIPYFRESAPRPPTLPGIPHHLKDQGVELRRSITLAGREHLHQLRISERAPAVPRPSPTSSSAPPKESWVEVDHIEHVVTNC